MKLIPFSRSSDGSDFDFQDSPRKRARAPKPKRRAVATRKLQTPTQTEMQKAARLRKMVFAISSVVIGLIALLITATSNHQSNYTIYRAKTFIAVGQHIHSYNLQAVVVHAPISDTPVVSKILGSVATQTIYPGELIQEPLLAKASLVPANDQLMGLTLASNHVPNGTMTPGEKVNLYFSGNNALPLSASKSIAPGQLLASATIIQVMPASSSNADVNIDVAVPSNSTGLVGVAAAQSELVVAAS